MKKLWKWIAIALAMALFSGCSGDDGNPPQTRGKPANCADYESIYNIYSAGFVHFRIANVGDLAWDITTEKTWRDPGDLCKANSVYDALPGFPTKLREAGSSLDNVNFFVHFETAQCLGDTKDEYPVFDMTLKSDESNVELTLSSSLKYKPPPPPSGHPFWDFLEDGIDMIKGLVELPEDPLGGFHDWASGLYGIASGGSGGEDSNNEVSDGYTGTFFITQLSGTMVNPEGQTVPLNPLLGSFCGGDEYAISDGKSLVVEMVAGRSKHSPGEVGLAVYSYANFFGIRAAQVLDYWRQQGDDYMKEPYSHLLERVFANYNDPDDHEICENADGTQGYFPAMSDIVSREQIEFWDLANNLGALCGAPYNDDETYCQYYARKFPYSCN